MIDLSVAISSLKLRNPTLLASGIIGTSPSLLLRVFKAGAGGVVTKSFTREPKEGYATPIIISVKCGFINAVGLTNPGIKGVLEIVKPLREKKVPTVVSIAGLSVEEFVELATVAEKAGANALELNLSCPHAEKRGIEIGMDSESVSRIVEEVKSSVKIPVFVKLGLMDNIINIASVAEESGADAIVLINTIKAMYIDIWVKKPVLSNKIGGLSGPSIHPIAVRVIYEVYKKVNIPIIGVGGVDSWESAVEMILAGASAVQLGSALVYKDYSIFNEICNGIKEYMIKNGFRKIYDFVGLAHDA